MSADAAQWAVAKAGVKSLNNWFLGLDPNARATVRRHLRSVFFTPEGLIEFLKFSVETGHMDVFNSEGLSRFFEERQPVKKAVEYFEQLNRRMGVQFDRDFIETLMLIGYQKFDVEAKVRTLVSSGNRRLATQEVSSLNELLGNITEINRYINELDREIGPL